MPEVISRKDAIERGLTHYYTGKPCPNGHDCQRFVSSYTCLECAQEHKRKYRKDLDFAKRELAYKKSYRAKNAEKISAYSAARWRDPSGVARRQNKESKDRRRDAINAAQRVENMTPEQIARRDESNRKSYIKHRDDRLARAKRNGAKRRGAVGSYTQTDVDFALAITEWTCICCGSDLHAGYEVDHIVPISRGGTNYPCNIFVLCKRCNIQKRAEDPVSWAVKVGAIGWVSYFQTVVEAHAGQDFYK